MSETPASDDEATDVTAAELALGVLDGEARAAALRRVLAEPGFAADVERWRTHLGQLFDLWPEAAPSASVANRLEASLDRLTGSVVAPPLAPSSAVPPVSPVGLWRGWAIGASALAASLLAVIVLRPDAPAPQPAPTVAARPDAALLAAAIAPVGDRDAAPVPVAALYDPANGGLRLTGAMITDPAHSAELWVITPDGKPHSLGVLKPTGTTVIALSAKDRARVAQGGSVLAVTLEVPGGSPTGLPQGPLIAKGPIAPI